jgi:hypothetical protein
MLRICKSLRHQAQTPFVRAAQISRNADEPSGHVEDLEYALDLDPQGLREGAQFARSKAVMALYGSDPIFIPQNAEAFIGREAVQARYQHG